jgi:cyclopropane-fatty-acyl-phospholipid synthase
MSLTLNLVERGWLPDAVVRLGIRRLLRQRLRSLPAAGTPAHTRAVQEFVAALGASPLAIETEKANEQHYELPPAFFQAALGPRLKYSSAFFERGNESLAEGEEAMLRLYVERGRFQDGQEVLELGCGWGSATLYLAERFPGSRILGVSNSRPQREFILSRAQQRGLKNVEIETADINRWDTARRFDRVISIEMFEHLRNYADLFQRIAGWLRPDGQLFTHIFCHRTTPYLFEVEGAAEESGDWMSRHFFTGGQMPSHDLFTHFQQHLMLADTWQVEGRHYARTSELWLANLDQSREQLLPVLAQAYGPDAADQWFHRWRVFFMACAELFGFHGGQEWWVSHYRFQRRP